MAGDGGVIGMGCGWGWASGWDGGVAGTDRGVAGDRGMAVDE